VPPQRRSKRLLPGIDPGAHPSDLSAGQRLGLALALVLAHEPKVVLLDEPTTGLDYRAKDALAIMAGRTERAGAPPCCWPPTTSSWWPRWRTGQSCWPTATSWPTDPAVEVVTHSPTLSPQVARILHPLPYLTVDDVLAALEAVR
jgi:hypothetical protein